MNNRECPFGGYCIDPGNPPECRSLIKDCIFSSNQEKMQFDSLPDKFKLILGETEIKFKNSTQIRFLFNDFKEWKNCKIYILEEDLKSYRFICLGIDYVFIT